MTLHQLRVFIKVAEMQSFTEAARSLRLTQPSTSALVQDLVKELKCKLFERRGIKVFLTQEGTALLRRARKALDIIEGTRHEIDEIQGLKKGRLRVGGSGLAASFLPAAIQAFKGKHPGIEITLTIDRSRNLENGLLGGDLDIGLLSQVHSPLLTYQLYEENDVIVIASPKHPLTKKRFVPLEILARERSVMFERGGLMYDMVQTRFAEGRISFKPTLEVKTRSSARDAIKSAVTSGLGIGFIASRHVEADINAGRLKALKVPDLNLKRKMYITVHKKRNSSPLVQCFNDFLFHHRY